MSGFCVKAGRWGALLVLLLGSACAQSGIWQNPDVPEDEWPADKAACQRIARQQAEQDYALSQQSDRSLNYDRGGQWASQMNQYSAQRDQGKLFESCMKQRGYQLVEPGSEGKR